MLPFKASKNSCRARIVAKEHVMAPLTPVAPHEVLNQSPPYDDIDLFASDLPLQESAKANGADEAATLSQFGRHWGSAEMFEQARLANVNEPTLKTFDAKGFPRDIVDFHPAHHAFMPETPRT